MQSVPITTDVVWILKHFLWKDGRHHRETNFLSQIMEEEYPSIYEK
jgi:hypothetical protein